MFAIELQAVSPHGQRRRAYEIHVGPDLFGQLVVTIEFGVIGTRGQRRVHLVADIAEAQAVVRRALRRRLTAPRRIGVPYRVIACHDPGCWLAMMRFQLIDGHLAITVPALAEPINSPRPRAGYQPPGLPERSVDTALKKTDLPNYVSGNDPAKIDA